MRLFVALELPGPVTAALEGWGRRLERPELRVLAPESLHVTLAFLGQRPPEEAGAIGGAVAACAAPVGRLRLGAPVWLGRGSALAVDVEDPDGACGRLQRTVSAALASLGVFTPESRPFRPHVTVARVRRGSRPDRRGVPEPPDPGPFAGTAVTLFESLLSPRGATYRAVVRADLPR